MRKLQIMASDACRALHRSLQLHQMQLKQSAHDASRENQKTNPTVAHPMRNLKKSSNLHLPHKSWKDHARVQDKLAPKVLQKQTKINIRNIRQYHTTIFVNFLKQAIIQQKRCVKLVPA